MIEQAIGKHDDLFTIVKMWKLKWDGHVTRSNGLKGLCKEKKFQKSEITLEVGGWVQVSLGIFFGGKSSQNSSKPVLIICSKPLCLYTHCYKLLVIMI